MTKYHIYPTVGWPPG